MRTREVRWRVLLHLGLGTILVLGPTAMSAKAEGQAGRLGEERRIILPRVRGERPPTIYGAANVPLVLTFDEPLAKGDLQIPGLDVQRHPVETGTLLLTPSDALATSAVPVTLSMPLASGDVALTLAFRPEAPDLYIRVSQPPDTSLAKRPVVPGPLPVAEVVVTEPRKATAAKAARQCRLNLLVRTAEEPEGYPMVLLAEHPSICDRRAKKGAGSR